MIDLNPHGIPKPGLGGLVTAAGRDTSARPSENKAAKPTGLAEISKTAEITKEIGTRVVEITKIAIGAHDPVRATIAAGGLLMSAIGTTAGIAGALKESPVVQSLKAIGTGGSVAATVLETVVEGTAWTTAIGLGGVLAAASVGAGAFTLTEIALKASASTTVGAWLGGGIGEKLADVAEGLRAAPPSIENRWSGEFRYSGIGY
jgi:hypothetical protein